ncbi:cytochrome P450 [Haliangium sp.]|uniref:cytochrome P450 n=1 Tax=Haliangium sp. TaxID=2663208 RepID=UPI003D12373C
MSASDPRSGSGAAPADPGAAPILFNPFDPAFIRDPYPTYRRMLESAPVYRTPIGIWLVTRYQDASRVMAEHRHFVHRFEDMARRRAGDRVATSPAFQSLSRWTLVLNPPDHTRIRGLLSKAFSARRVDALRPQIQAIMDRLIDAVIDRGHGDLMTDFARPFPITVICELLGIPEDERERFLDESCLPAHFLEPRPLSGPEIDSMDAAVLSLNEYLGALCDKRRAEPRDDLTTALVQAEEHGDTLTQDELVATLVLLFFAGHETTVNLIGNGSLALFRHPDQLAKLRADPGLIPNAIEEMLRFDPPAQIAGLRCATEEQTFAGETLPAGSQIVPVIAAANRDPEVFDRPEEFDVTRQFDRNTKVLSFGGGIHFCTGAMLARVEAGIAFETLLRRLPGLRAEQPPEALEPPRRPSYTLRGITSLPVRWA